MRKDLSNVHYKRLKKKKDSNQDLASKPVAHWRQRNHKICQFKNKTKQKQITYRKKGIRRYHVFQQQL